MTKKNIVKSTVGIVSIALLLGIGITASCLCAKYYTNIQSYMQRFSSAETGNTTTTVTRDEAQTNALQTCEKLESEGMVLLKNQNDTLPLTSSDHKINLFGYNSYKTVYTDYGSGGHHNEDNNFNFIDGFEFAGLQLNSELTQFYKDTAQQRAAQQGLTVSSADFNIYEQELDEYTDYSATIWDNAAAYSDTAVYVIGRMAGEGGDAPLDASSLYGCAEGNHYLELQPAEEALLEKLENTFDKVIVIVNSSNPMNLGFIDDDKVDAAIWAGGPGSTGTIAVGKALLGEYNPSGHLPDTYAYDVTSAPSYQNFGDFTYSNVGDPATPSSSLAIGNINHYVYYQEGIYVGYRYYETRYIGNDNVYDATEEAAYQEAVQFPFGYGLSYTTFDWSDPSFTVKGQGDTIDVSVKVTNTGDVAGKDVVELYYTAPYTPGGIEKSAVVLGAFAKTSLLEPGESETVSMTMNFDDMSSYDYKNHKCYVLESGDYILSLRTDAHTVKDSSLTYTYHQDEDIDYDTVARKGDATPATNLFDDVTEGDGNINSTLPYLSRNDWDGTFPSREASTDLAASDEVVSRLNNESYGSLIDISADPTLDTTFSQGADNGVTLESVAGLTDSESSLWDDLLDHMSVEDMNNLYGNDGWCSPAIESIGKEQVTECDGPTGIHDLASGLEAAEYTTEPVVAATWNVELARLEGESYGDEDLVNSVCGTYAPGMNIHRSAFGGRSAEYYSEDPLLSGKMGAQMITGLQSKGIYVYAKHFALNEQETNRNGVLTWANEQAIREIYLRSFEIPVKEINGDGLNQFGLTGIMESYNRIGTQPSSYNHALLTDVLRGEWNYRGVVNTDAFASADGDYAIRAGVDMQLAMGVYVTDRTTGTNYGMSLLRQATKRHLMIYANSSAMTSIRDWTPYWLWYLALIWVVLVAGMVCLFIFLVKPAFWPKKDKKEEQAPSDQA